MRPGDWEVLSACYEAAIPAADVAFSHHWRDVSIEDGRFSCLRVLRPRDIPQGVGGQVFALRRFLENIGPAMYYPLGLFGLRVGFAVRAIAEKEMMSFVRYPDSACFTASPAALDGGGYSYGRTVVLSEGFADAEAVGRFHPFSVATMGGPIKLALIPVFARLVRRVALMFDHDASGEEAARRTRIRLEAVGVGVVDLSYPEVYGDPADFLLDDLVGMGRVAGCLL